LVYFFVNSAGLPWGLLYTTLLTPLFYYWVIKTRQTEIMIPFLAAILPFFILQVMAGVTMGNYIASLVNIAAVYVFAQAVYTFVLVCEDKEKLFRRVLYLNFILCLVAIPFYFTPWYDIFWISQDFTQGVSHFLRLKMFTYEASYYAVIFSPVFFFYFWQYMLRQNRIKGWKLLFLLGVPYIISLSLGVIMGLLLALCGTLLLYSSRLFRSPRVAYFVSSTILLAFAGIVVIMVFFPDNALVVRLGNIWGGKDMSSRGRTTDAFYLSERILELKNPWVGIGPGQLKPLGGQIIRTYYNYTEADVNIAIPNAVAETLMVFGWIGLVLRFAVELGLFFYTKPWKNYYRLTLFLFIFIYQFTGSYITSTVEYVIWILAFTNAFPQFDVPLAARGSKIKIHPDNARLQNL
jgi:hypothetical protein